MTPALSRETFDIPGVVLVHGRRLVDHRGHFEETWNQRHFAELGIATAFVQDNQSRSWLPNTLRGLHYQAPPHAQAKLVRCVSGSICDVVVDVRAGSPAYGQWRAITLSANANDSLYIPEGLLHGFLALVPNTVVQYKCSAFYDPASEEVVRWDSVGIDWPLTGAPVVSARDAEGMPFAEFRSPFTYDAAP